MRLKIDGGNTLFRRLITTTNFHLLLHSDDVRVQKEVKENRIGFGGVNRFIYRSTKAMRSLKNAKTSGLDEVMDEIVKNRDS